MLSWRRSTGPVLFACAVVTAHAQAQTPARPRAYLGLQFECSRCTIINSDAGYPRIFEFSSPPVLFGVDDGGPADRAGMQPGDTITHVDGIDIGSRDGGLRFASLEPGASVVFTVRRGGVARELTVQPAESREGMQSRDLEKAYAGVVRRLRETLASLESQPRYSGSFAGVEVRVTGPEPVSVTAIGPDCRLIIAIGSTRVLLNPDKPCSR